MRFESRLAARPPPDVRRGRSTRRPSRRSQSRGSPAKAIGRWFPYVATLALFIWVVNLLGFIPLPLSDEKFHVGGVALPTWGIYAATSSGLSGDAHARAA